MNKLKKILFWICSAGFMLCVFLLFLFCKEPFQPTEEDDLIQVIDDFCSKYYGDDWNMDSIYSYNDKLVFIVIQTKDATIDLSIQPKSRVIIVEKIKGKVSKHHPHIVRY